MHRCQHGFQCCLCQVSTALLLPVSMGSNAVSSHGFLQYFYRNQHKFEWCLCPPPLSAWARVLSLLSEYCNTSTSISMCLNDISSKWVLTYFQRNQQGIECCFFQVRITLHQPQSALIRMQCLSSENCNSSTAISCLFPVSVILLASQSAWVRTLSLPNEFCTIPQSAWVRMLSLRSEYYTSFTVINMKSKLSLPSEYCIGSS